MTEPSSINKKTEYSVVIPTMNEEASLGEVLTKLKGMSNDIFIVDGHSSDNTQNIAKKHGVRIVLDNKLGKGDAIRIGLKEAKHPITVFIDADLSHDPSDVTKLITPISKGDADLVIGSRMTGGSDELHGTIEEAIRLFGSVFIALVINYRFGVKITDYENGFRAIRTEVGNNLDLKSNIATIEQEMAMKCLKYGYKIAEVPTHEYRRQGGVSKINVWKVGHKFVWSLLTGIFTFRTKK